MPTYKYPSLRSPAPTLGIYARLDSGAAAADQWTADGTQNGTLNNGTTRIDDSGLAYSFDGTDDNISFGDVLDSVCTGASAKFSIAAWVKLTASGNCMILSKLGDGSHGESVRQFGFRCNGGALNLVWFGAADGSTVRVLTTSTNLNGAGWQHVAMTFDATISNADNKATLWLNGSSQTITVATSTGSPVSIPDTTARLAAGAAIGAASSTVSYRWQGCIDDLLVYPRILTSTEIANLAAQRGAAYQTVAAGGLINSQSLVGRGDLVSGRQLVGFST